MEVEGLEGEGSKRVDVSIGEDNPCAKQHPDEVGICDICNLSAR